MDARRFPLISFMMKLDPHPALPHLIVHLLIQDWLIRLLDISHIAAKDIHDYQPIVEVKRLNLAYCEPTR